MTDNTNTMNGPLPYFVTNLGKTARRHSFGFFCRKSCDFFEADELDNAACRYAENEDPTGVPDCVHPAARREILKKIIDAAVHQLSELEGEQ